MNKYYLGILIEGSCIYKTKVTKLEDLDLRSMSCRHVVGDELSVIAFGDKK